MPLARRRVLFRCDASGLVGGGHAMRCLTLANALAEKGAKVLFVAAAMPKALEERIVVAGHRLERIPASAEMQREDTHWEEPPLSDGAQLADAEATGAAIRNADWVVVDHYLLDARWHSAAREFADSILAIDDLCNRSYDCDILLDQTFGRSARDYRALVRDGAKVLAGTAYALLRPEFARERPAALERRIGDCKIRRILVFMGTADPGGITAQVVEHVLAATSECTVDVVLGPQAPSLGQVRQLAAQHSRIIVHVDRNQMAELMRDSDLAIGATGTTSWERCCLGLPTISIVLAENQRLAATNLARADAIALAETPEEIPALLRSFMTDERRRLSMVAASAVVTDGSGTQRMISAMAGESLDHGQLKFRSARPEDSRDVWLWRNDYLTRKFSQTTAAIVWADHEKWWDKTLGSAERHLLIAEVGGVAVAAVRFDRVSVGEFEVSINLAPEARGAGLGRRILGKACSEFQKKSKSESLIATIHRDNVASRSIFEEVGFVSAGALSNFPFQRYVLPRG